MNLLNILLILAGLYALFFVFFSMKEGFGNLGYGSFPEIIDTALLSCFYPVKKEPELNDVNYSVIAKDQPRTPMSSYEQITNNFKFWETPNNGTCTPAEFCNSIYSMKHIEKPELDQPDDKKGIRVNYFVSE